MAGKLRVEVPGIGVFLFRHRTFRDSIRIAAEVEQMLGFQSGVSGGLQSVAAMFATLTTLLEEAPAGFDLETMDPLNDSSLSRLEEVYLALRAVESNFRNPNPAGSEGPSAGAVAPD